MLWPGLSIIWQNYLGYDAHQTGICSTPEVETWEYISWVEIGYEWKYI